MLYPCVTLHLSCIWKLQTSVYLSLVFPAGKLTFSLWWLFLFMSFTWLSWATPSSCQVLWKRASFPKFLILVYLFHAYHIHLLILSHLTLIIISLAKQSVSLESDLAWNYPTWMITYWVRLLFCNFSIKGDLSYIWNSYCALHPHLSCLSSS